MTSSPADPQRPDNLWRPVPGDHGAHGSFDDQSRQHTWQLWATMHRPWLALGVAGLALLGTAALCRSRIEEK
jgi:hypothetical protein